jgi:hypothetical protein
MTTLKSPEIISEERLEKALRYLANSDADVAQLKAEVSRREYAAKLARAKVFLMSEGSVEQKKALAESSEGVQEAENNLADTIAAFEALKAKRQTEALIVDVWRSLNSARTHGVLT